LRQQLKGEGFDTTDRTIQRDLAALSARFPLINDEDHKPFGWSWAPDARAFDLPGLSAVGGDDVDACRAIRELTSCLRVWSGRSSRSSEMAPTTVWISEAAAEAFGGSWLNKVRSVPPTQPLLPPKILDEVQAVVSEALFLERQVEIDYRRRGSASVETWRIHPLALVQRGSVLYLHCRIGDYLDARNLPLHRIRRALMLAGVAEPPPGHDMDAKAAHGIWHFGGGNALQVTLRFSREAGEHLFETPLAADQRIDEEGDSLIVRAVLADTPQLRWWLRGFGDGVEVLEPTELRREMSEVAARVVARYGDAA
jgi:predicted DNA-binding transcriptional regulator YafY